MSLLLLFLIVPFASSEYDVNDDTAFRITWTVSQDVSGAERKSVQLKTALGEKYHCFLPPAVGTEYKFADTSNLTVDHFGMLKKLFGAQLCYTRSEAYWSYELCHGKHVRQYHEELMPDKSSQTQEYSLGYFSYPEYPLFEASSHQYPPTILLGGSMYPYFSVNFTDGTPCDLIKINRTSSVLYVCSEDDDGRIMQVSEVESCRYQLVFATRHLCNHPSYRPPKRSVASVPCFPHGDSPQKPAILDEFEKEQKQLTNFGASSLAALFGTLGFSNVQVEAERQSNMIVYRIRTSTSDINSEGTDGTSTGSSNSESSSSETSDPRSLFDKYARMRTKMSENVDPASIREASRGQLRAFLQGQFCLVGETAGWWTHEICFKTNVTQYHRDKQGERSQVVLLGRWDPKVHLEWLSQQDAVDTSELGTTFKRAVFFYGDGDYCNEVSRKRHTIVNLKCVQSANGIHLSFAEHQKCKYSVTIESSVLCDYSVEEFHKLNE